MNTRTQKRVISPVNLMFLWTLIMDIIMRRKGKQINKHRVLYKI